MFLIDSDTSWTRAEEEAIARILATENVPRLEAIRRMSANREQIGYYGSMI